MAANPIQTKDPVDYVNPNIGGIGQMLTATAPTVLVPRGMMRLAPVTTPGITDRYLADRIYGFPAGGVTLMPMAGAAETDPVKFASLYDHDLETTTPYYYAATSWRTSRRPGANGSRYASAHPSWVSTRRAGTCSGRSRRGTSIKPVCRRPGDRRVHSADGHGFYPGSGGLWGSYRSLYPLLLLLDPAQQVEFVHSFLALYDQTGRMLGTGRTGMIGHHVVALVLDTYVKGYRDFDVAKAYEGLKKNAMEATMLPWRDGPLTSLDRVYLEKGFFPALKKGEKETVQEVHPFERRQAVGVTLEAAYDDWCTAQLAKTLNRQDDYEYFTKRAHNYQNVFDERVGFMAPKSEDGQWVFDAKDFNPIWGGGQGGRDYYTEMNAWTYTFHVQQDVAGLINLLGGRARLAAKLDRLFQEQYGGYGGDPERGGVSGTKYFFLGQFPDMTGLIGQYAHGNEPSFHIPYLYNYAGEPWKTQRRVRDIMKIWYDAGPLGISGDEDNGEESSWYVLSAMGFFTVCPGRPVYDIGSPIFEETRLTLGGGEVFVIKARNVSAVNKYIQSAALNGKRWNKPWFEHGDIAKGGTLVLEMGPRPNKAWGSAPEAAPPSMSPERPDSSN